MHKKNTPLNIGVFLFVTDIFYTGLITDNAECSLTKCSSKRF